MANNLKIGAKLSNFQEMQELLRVLPVAVGNKVMATAIGAAALPIERLAKQKAPRRHGYLAESITHVVRKYPGSKTPAIAIVGPDKDFSRSRLLAGGDRKGVDRPSKYAHLVEFGHLTVPGTDLDTPALFRPGEKRRAVVAMGGRVRTVTTFVAAQPFLRPAVAGAEGASASAFEKGVERGLERETKRLSRKYLKTA